MNRRHFLSLLSALPFVGKLVPRETVTVTLYDPSRAMAGVDPWVPMTYKGEPIPFNPGVDPRDAIFVSGDQWPESVRRERISAGRPVSPVTE